MKCTSAQAAERSRIIRQSFSGFADHRIDIHTQFKHGGVFTDGDRPYMINYVGTASALETERMEARERRVAGALSFAQLLSQFREIGVSAEVVVHYLKDEGGMTIREIQGFLAEQEDSPCLDLSGENPSRYPLNSRANHYCLSRGKSDRILDKFPSGSGCK